MKTMWKKTLEDLGFQAVLKDIVSCALSEDGAEQLRLSHFITDLEQLRQRQVLVGDIVKILSSGKGSAPEQFPPMAEALQALSQPGVALDGVHLYDIGCYVHAAVALRDFFRSPMAADGNANAPAVPNPVASLLADIPDELRLLADDLLDALESPGQVKETHPAIRSLKKEIDRRRAERARYSQDFIHASGAVMQNDQPVYRDGRIVMPVRNDQRGEVQGFVHSTSSSGSTVFVEPYRLVELNNSVIMAEQQVMIEIARILGELTRKVRGCEDQLRVLTRDIAQADALYACARWAHKHGCVATELSEHAACRLLGARHPQLKGKAVPITMELDESIRAVVISGPNAGGKTVTIKTVGLFALLNQFCGFIPATEGSSLPIFDGVYTDIGDDQSIEQQLSTFSGHMKQVGLILHACTPRSLVILDELGSGTDPVEGAAIARAVMEYSVSHAALTLVTSHHGVLKQYAYASDEVLNASMEFDERTHEPTFHVISGVPGESHAVDTARRMRLPDSVIKAAQGYLGDESVQISTIIKGLEQRRKEADEREHQIELRYRQLQSQVKDVELKRLKVDQQENLVRKEQLGDLRQFIGQKRKELENLVAELREGEITREKTLKVRQFIASMEEKERQAAEKQDAKEQQLARQAMASVGKIVFAPGMDVLCGVHKREGRILRADGKGKWIVAIGPMKFSLKEADLSVPVRSSQAPKVSVSYQSSAPKPKLTIDVRGCTLDEALEQVATEIEACIVHGVATFSIIHGYGDGILSRGIADYLKTQKTVSEYHFALPEDGGMGKTYVELG